MTTSPLEVGARASPDGGADQADVQGLGALLQLVERGFLPLAELGLKGLGPGLVVLALESRGNGGAELPNERLHAAPQPAAPAGRELQRPRLVGFLEVVNVAPVGRHRHGGRRLLDLPPGEGVLAGARGAVDEDVVAVAPDADAEPDRVKSAFLAEVVRYVVGLAGPRQVLGITLRVKLIRRQRFRYPHHGFRKAQMRRLAGCVKTPPQRGNGPLSAIPAPLSVIPAKQAVSKPHPREATAPEIVIPAPLLRHSRFRGNDGEGARE